VTDVPAAELDVDRDMANDYGLTSLNKVLLLTSVCDDAAVSVSHFTEEDVAGMRTLRSVIDALGAHAGPAVRA
jgi:acyl carrier protein